MTERVPARARSARTRTRSKENAFGNDFGTRSERVPDAFRTRSERKWNANALLGYFWAVLYVVKVNYHLTTKRFSIHMAFTKHHIILQTYFKFSSVFIECHSSTTLLPCSSWFAHSRNRSDEVFWRSRWKKWDWKNFVQNSFSLICRKTFKNIVW